MNIGCCPEKTPNRGLTVKSVADVEAAKPEFEVVFRGYDRAQVDDFIDAVFDALSELVVRAERSELALAELRSKQTLPAGETEAEVAMPAAVSPGAVADSPPRAAKVTAPSTSSVNEPSPASEEDSAATDGAPSDRSITETPKPATRPRSTGFGFRFWRGARSDRLVQQILNTSTTSTGGAEMANRIEVSVPSIHCQSCQRAIEGALRPIAGVKSADVDIPAKTVLVEFEPPATQQTVVTAIEDQGYDIETVREKVAR